MCMQMGNMIVAFSDIVIVPRFLAEMIASWVGKVGVDSGDAAAMHMRFNSVKVVGRRRLAVVEPPWWNVHDHSVGDGAAQYIRLARVDVEVGTYVLRGTLVL